MKFFHNEKSETRNAWDHLEHTKLVLPLMEIRLLEFCRIELLASVWLRDAGIDYTSLEREKAWLVLVGAWFAMRYADQCKEIKTERKDERVPNGFCNLLQIGMPLNQFHMICRELDGFQHSEDAVRLKKQLKERLCFSDFEAHVMMLAVEVSAALVDNDPENKKVQDNLYQYFLRARDDYFQGE